MTDSCTAASGDRPLRNCKPLFRWTTQEIHGRIWIWFSSTDAPPAWSLPEALSDPALRWRAGGRLDRTFSSHPQDIIENAVDPHHFLFIHGMSEVLDANIVYDEHCITTRLRARSHIGSPGHQGVHVRGRHHRQGLWPGASDHPYGDGQRQKLGLEVNTLVVEGITPREAGKASLLVELHMARTLPPGAMWLARRAFLRAVTMDVDADIQVWANRRHLQNPQLTSADGEIGRYRKWARRFYPNRG